MEPQPYLAKRQYFTKVDDAYEVVFECTIYPPEQLSEIDFICPIDIYRDGSVTRRGFKDDDAFGVFAIAVSICLFEESNFLATFSGPLYFFESSDEEIDLENQRLLARFAINKTRYMMKWMKWKTDALMAAYPFLKGEPGDGYWIEE